MRLILCAVFLASLVFGSTTALAANAAGKDTKPVQSAAYQANVPVTGVALNKTGIAINKGKTYRLTASVKPTSATNKKVTWKSGNTKIATVSSSGLVKGIKTGSVYIYVTTADGNKSAKCKVTVGLPVSGVSLNKLTMNLDQGKTYQLKATVKPSSATNKKVTWKSGNTKVATVSSSGVVKGVGAGTVYIYVYTVDGKKSAKCKVTVKHVEVRGSTTGNAVNGGDAQRYGDWIYYSCWNESIEKWELKKIKTDGTARSKLFTGNANSINVTGGWVYFGGQNLYKMRTDGTGKTTLASGYSNQVSVVDGWIYYLGESGSYSFYKMRTDGTGKKKLYSGYMDNINVTGGWVYFTVYEGNEDNWGCRLYKIRTDGTGKTKLSSDDPFCINAADGWIYYIKDTSGEDDDARCGYIYKMRPDGTGKTKINQFAYGMNVQGGWIYYFDGSYLCKMHTDGTAKKKLVRAEIGYGGDINIAGDWIYYFIDIGGDNFNSCRIRTDGTGNQLVQ
jgi:hypothetical protein